MHGKCGKMIFICNLVLEDEACGVRWRLHQDLRNKVPQGVLEADVEADRGHHWEHRSLELVLENVGIVCSRTIMGPSVPVNVQDEAFHI